MHLFKGGLSFPCRVFALLFPHIFQAYILFPGDSCKVFVFRFRFGDAISFVSLYRDFTIGSVLFFKACGQYMAPEFLDADAAGGGVPEDQFGHSFLVCPAAQAGQ